MATTPQFTGTPEVTWAQLVSAHNTTDGTDAAVQLLFTAASSGSFVNKIVLQPRGTSTTPATFPAGVFRLYVNNGSAVGTGTNNSLIREQLMPVLTNGLDADTTTLICYTTEIVLNAQLPNGYRLYGGYTGALSAAIILQVTAFGGDF